MNRVKQFVGYVRQAIKPTEPAWRSATIAIAVFWLLFLVFHSIPLLITDFTFEKLIGFLTVVIALVLGGIAAVLALRFANSLPLRFTLTLLIPAPLIMLSLGVFGTKGTLVLYGAGLVSIIFIAGSIGTLLSEGLRPATQKVNAIVLLTGLVGISISIYMVFIRYEDPNPLLQSYQLADRTLDLPDPSERGSHKVGYTTYGSGEDPHRTEYSTEVGFQSESVDASKLIDNWEKLVGWSRSSYWGFGPDALPVQGRVWYPVDDGPFPLVLIVHGNHTMEDYSDTGYGYLGELLASRGYIVVSVDENFLNSSIGDFINPLEPRIKEENDARGWLLLEHLKQWRDWNQQEDHLFSGKVDINNISLIGHSRGGEAVAIASYFNDLSYYPDDATLSFGYHFEIKSVIAIAPVDGQYKPRERGTPVRGTSYFSIHGSMDGDVSSFMGLTQFNRVELSNKDQIAATLYIFGANHGQFNTSWGNADALIDWALNKDAIMPEEDQRQIARVYFSALLDMVHRGKHQYLPLFRDAAYGASWLPDTYYVNNIREYNTEWLLNFEEDGDPGTSSHPGIVQTENLSRWFESWHSLKWEPLETHVVTLAWDKEFSADASYTVTFDEPMEFIKGDALVFSVSQGTGSTMPDGHEANGEESAETDDEEVTSNKDPEPLNWTIVIADSDDNELQVQLASVRQLYPQVKEDTLKPQFAYGSPQSEIVLQHFQFPYSSFENAGAFNGQLSRVEFRFDDSPKGIIVLDDLGIRRKEALQF